MTDYSQKGHYYHEAPRRELVRMLPLLQSSSTVMDIGAGYGNNTKLLLSLGHTVTALEPNKKAAQGLKDLKSEFPGKLDVYPESVDTFSPLQQYDALISCMVLHFLDSRNTTVAVLEKMKDWTAPGGLNLITSYLETSRLDKKEYSFQLKPDELRELYDGWEILWYEESYPVHLRNLRGVSDLLWLIPGHRGYKSARLIARKPR